MEAHMQIERKTIIADVEHAEAKARKTPLGPVYDEIIEEVAAKHGVGSADVRSIMADHWKPMGAY